MTDDGDVVRGLGFVTMYAAWLEEEIDDLLRILDPVETFSETIQRWPIGRKLSHAASIVKKLPDAELKGFPKAIEDAKHLFEWRNEVVHGRIYAGHDRVDYIQSGRPKVPDRPITSAELYKLANAIWNYRGAVYGPTIFRVPRAIAEYMARPKSL